MSGRPRPRRVLLEARAKLNLGLAVGPRRGDGFHDLATFFQSVSLADTLRAERRRKGFTLQVRHESVALRGGGGGSKGSAVPAGSGNLVLVAARAFARATGLEGGAQFELIKRIPVRAGLGGGSADAAAAIVALSSLYGVVLPASRKLSLAAAVGSDVPFALTGGTALGLGRGERLRRVTPAREFRAVIAVPRWTISTSAAFRELDRSKYGLTAWATKLRFAQSIGRKRLRMEQALRLGNSFEHALGRRGSDFESLCARLRAAGIEQPRLTGSGSAVFGVLPPHASVRRFMERFVGNEALHVVRSLRRGVQIVQAY
jgi:4-diphosphocytidyl-2C-methyl-D-erythritol kinase